MRPRICLVLPHTRLGGGEVAMAEVAQGLASQVDLDVCALDSDPSPTATLLREELAERFGAVSFLGERWELRPRFRAADAVLWYGVVNAVPDVLASMGRRPASVRVVHTDREVDGPGIQRRWRRVIDRTVCVCPQVARRLPASRFIPNPGSPERLRGPRCEPFPPGRKTLGFLGRLVPQKNAAWLVEHAAQLGCNLLIQALDTPYQTVDDLARLAGLHGVAERVRFLPPGRDVGMLVKSVDAVAIVSRHEGFPLAVVEAGMVGTPVIATRVGALPELFADEILFVDSADGKPVCASVAAALARLDRSWGEKLRDKVVPLCDRTAIVRSYAEVLREAIG